MHPSIQPDVAGGREKIEVVAQTKRQRKVRGRPPLVLRVKARELVPKVQVHAVAEGRRGWPGKQTGLEGQCPLGNLLAEIGSGLQKQKLYRSAGAERRGVERRHTEETLRSENASSRCEESRLCADPHGLKISAKLERMFASYVGEIFGGLEMLLAVVGYAALDAAGIKEVGDQERRLKPGAYGIEVEGSAAKAEDGFGSPVSPEQME